jgi:hypothetical protein
VETERSVGLIDQGRDVADIHGLMQVDELAALPQAVEKLAEILLHRRRSGRGERLLASMA